MARPPRHVRIVSAETPAPTGSASDLPALGRSLVHAVDMHVSAGLQTRLPDESMLRALDTSGRLLAIAMLAPSGRSMEILEPWLNVTAHTAAPQLRRELAAMRCKVCGKSRFEYPAPDHAFNTPPVGAVKKEE